MAVPHSLIIEIQNCLIKHHMDQDISIYANNTRISTPYSIDNPKPNTTHDGYGWLIEPNVTHKPYIPFGNPKTLTMAFEGPLYERFNDPFLDQAPVDELVAIFKRYGYYHELGYAWSLCLYPIESDDEETAWC